MLDFVGICAENDVYLLTLYVDAFFEDFFNLKTGLAGMMLQKFINYHIRVVFSKTKEKNGMMHMVFIQW